MTVLPTMDHALCSEEEHSPPLSENAGGGSWLHWENEISSISGLNIDSTTELNGLVEDKEVAARAVALVVNSTRKGIVPLCADIASLLRAKRSLEKKVYLLKRDLEALRSSTSVSFRTSHSTSPTIPLIDQQHIHTGHGQDRSRPCSRCSQCSVSGATGHNAIINTPITATNNNNNVTPTTASTTTASASSPSTSKQQQQHLSSPSVSRPTSTRTSPRPVRSTTRATGSRKNSLPEMTCEPSTEVKRVSPKISKGTQCTSSLPVMGDTPLEEQFLETVRLNSKLSEELGSARKEIEFLKGRLKELEMKQLARECSSHEQYRLQSSRDNNNTNTVTSDPLSQAVAAMTSCRHAHNRHRRPRSNGLPPSHRVSAPPGSLLYAEPLYGCKCSACDEAMGSDIHTALSAALNQELQKFPISSNALVQLGDHVVIKGEKTGRIRYIGHLDKIGQPNMVFVGLELDAPVGHHDGFFNNKRYFFCQKDHGLFVPLHDMVCKVSEKNETGCIEKTDGVSSDDTCADRVTHLSSLERSIENSVFSRSRPLQSSGIGMEDGSVEMTSMTSHQHVSPTNSNDSCSINNNNTNNNNNNSNNSNDSSEIQTNEDYV